jgi:hypothetical protein
LPPARADRTPGYHMTLEGSSMRARDTPEKVVTAKTDDVDRAVADVELAVGRLACLMYTDNPGVGTKGGCGGPAPRATHGPPVRPAGDLPGPRPVHWRSDAANLPQGSRRPGEATRCIGHHQAGLAGPRRRDEQSRRRGPAVRGTPTWADHSASGLTRAWSPGRSRGGSAGR